MRAAAAIAVLLVLNACAFARVTVEENGRSESVTAFGLGVANMDATLPSEMRARQEAGASGEAELAGTLRQESLGVDQVTGGIATAFITAVVSLAEVAIHAIGGGSLSGVLTLLKDEPKPKEPPAVEPPAPPEDPVAPAAWSPMPEWRAT